MNQPVEKTQVSSTTLLQRITSEYFVVTKTLLIDQESTIIVDEGSTWSNLWWGQKIEASGMIRLDIGVDLGDLKEEDIEIDQINRKIKIKLPEASILDASQFGDIKVSSSKGILRFFLENDPNEDHNQALKQLINDAIQVVSEDKDMFAEARRDAIKLIELIIKDLDYTLSVED